MPRPRAPVEIRCDSEAETQAAGARLAARLFARARPCFVRLEGTLGAGKTTFARGFIGEWLRLAGAEPPVLVTSPTYNIVKSYPAGERAALAHVDLYRVETFAELEALGYEQYFFESGCCLVEWLERIPEALAARPPGAVTVRIGFEGGSRRKLTIEDPKKSS